MRLGGTSFRDRAVCYGEILANTMLICPAPVESQRVLSQAKAKTNVGSFSLLTAIVDM